MRSVKLFLVGMCAATALAMACGGSTTNTGGGNEGDSGGSSGGGSGSGSSSGGGDATSSSSSGGSGSSSGAGSSSGGQGEGGLTCTPTSCGASSVCCASFTGGMVTDMCVSGSMCPMGSRQVCDPNNSNCPPGEMCVVRNGGMYGTCRTPRDGGPMDAAGGG